MTKEVSIEQDEGYITQEGAGEGIEQDHGTIKELVIAGPRGFGPHVAGGDGGYIGGGSSNIGGGSSSIRDINPGL